MRRRLILAGGAASLAATAVGAQEAGRIYRLGHLGLTATSERLTRDFTLPELERLGFIVGRNLVFDARIGPAEAMPALAREILAASPDAIVAIGSQATRAMHDATRSVPIVMFAVTVVPLSGMSDWLVYTVPSHDPMTLLVPPMRPVLKSEPIMLKLLPVKLYGL